MDYYRHYKYDVLNVYSNKARLRTLETYIDKHWVLIWSLKISNLVPFVVIYITCFDLYVNLFDVAMVKNVYFYVLCCFTRLSFLFLGLFVFLSFHISISSQFPRISAFFVSEQFYLVVHFEEEIVFFVGTS